MNELALFAGAGGGILGGKLLGWRTVCAVENDPYAASVLVARQNDKTLDPFPIWDDVQTFDGRPWRGIVDIVSGGFPCQDISVAGKGAGITGERSGMWKHMARIIGEAEPWLVWAENSPALIGRGLEVVLEDLWKMGYDARWGIVSAENVGAPHQRKRIWILATNFRLYSERTSEKIRPDGEESEWEKLGNIREDISDSGGYGAGKVCWERSEKAEISGCKQNLANSDSSRELQQKRNFKNIWGRTRNSSQSMADTKQPGLERRENSGEQKKPKPWDGSPFKEGWGETWWEVEPRLGRVVDGVAHRVDRLKAIGNGQVPAVVELAWRTLNK